MGDRDGRKVGVISEPTVNVLNIPSLLGKVKDSNNNHNEMLNEDDKNENNELFAVAVSDGLIDFVQPIHIGQRLAQAMYHGPTTVFSSDDDNDGNHTSLLEACEELIYESSNSWLNIGMRYRDDITIAVGKISI